MSSIYSKQHNKTQGTQVSKQVWLLRWISERFVVKTLAPPRPQKSRRFSGGSDIVSRSVPDLSNFESLRHTDLEISKLKLKFSNGVENFNPKIEIFRKRRRKLTKTSQWERVRWWTKINNLLAFMAAFTSISSVQIWLLMKLLWKHRARAPQHPMNDLSEISFKIA